MLGQQAGGRFDLLGRHAGDLGGDRGRIVGGQRGEPLEDRPALDPASAGELHPTAAAEQQVAGPAFVGAALSIVDGERGRIAVRRQVARAGVRPAARAWLWSGGQIVGLQELVGVGADQQRPIIRIAAQRRWKSEMTPLNYILASSTEY